MKILRIHYEHATNPKVKNTYFDIELDPNKEKIRSVELINILERIEVPIESFEVVNDGK